VYIDYNADLDFVDAGELVYSSPATTVAVTGNISIPTTAITGNTRMRVVMKDAAITGPCEVFTYGEVEDYTLNLQPVTTSCSAPTTLAASSIGTTTANLSWAAATGASNYTLQYKKSTVTTWTSVTVTGTSSALSGLSSATTYNWQVRANCTSGSSAYAVGSNFTTLTTCTDSYESNNTLSAAKSITVNSNINALISSSTDIDWFKFSNTSTAKNIRVTLNNLPADYDLRLYNSAGTVLYSSENGGTTSEVITYNNAPVATYYVRVIGYNGAFNSSACYRINASRSSTAFKENPYAEDDVLHESEGVESVLNVFPNPSTNGVFTFHLSNNIEGLYSLEVFDAAGRLLEEKTLHKKEGFIKTDINLSGHGKGMYLLKVHNDMFQQTVRLVISE
jgi:hypothetical protein